MPPRDARAFTIPAGHFFRIDQHRVAAGGDPNLWNANDLSEKGIASQFHLGAVDG